APSALGDDSHPRVSRIGILSDRSVAPLGREANVLGDQPYEQLLRVIESRVMSFSEVLQDQNRRLGRDLLAPLDPAQGTVRFRKISMALLEPFDAASGKSEDEHVPILLPFPRFPFHGPPGRPSSPPLDPP
ncbi:unnamed protein product, partial [Prorocentrum cordatum]